MSIHFQSYRSSSAGNCLALWTATSSILIDCGFRVQYQCRDVLESHGRQAGHLDAVIVSHSHGDHVSYSSLRVLAREGIPVLADSRVVRQLRDAHAPQDWKDRPDLRAFAGATFDVGDFTVTPIEVRHAPRVPNFGFVIAARGRTSTRRIVVCTDFNDYTAIMPHLGGADFIFVEANHDLDLLRQFPNPPSYYHLNNVKCASLLLGAVSRFGAMPKAVMLGHLSEERNRRALALSEVVRAFSREGTRVGFHLDAAPARHSSAVVEIQRSVAGSATGTRALRAQPGPLRQPHLPNLT